MATSKHRCRRRERGGDGRRRKRNRDGKHRRRRRMARKDLSALPDAALLSILQRLTNFPDFFAFDGVCRSWRAVSKPALADLVSSQPPLLCGTGGHHHFYSFRDGRSYRSTLPGLCREREGALVAGFAEGYLIMVCAGELWLVNPFTGDEVNSIPRVPCTHSVDWAVLTAPPASSGCVLVAWCRLSILYWRPGELYWSMYWCETEEERACTRWPVVLDGAVYARNIQGNVLKFEFFPYPRVTHFGERDLLSGAMNVWLVASGGEVLAIHANPGLCFVLYRFDRSCGEWVKLENLGDRSLLLTPFRSALSDDHPAKWGGEANCIYYYLPTQREVKVFRMGVRETGTFPVGITPPNSHPECYPGLRCSFSFVWVLPSLCY